jgi:superfamily II DNA/RNA helicase
MATIEHIERRIKRLTTKGFRNRLLDRGLARELIWKEGEVPEGAPPFSTELSADLVDYGFTMLRLGLQLRGHNTQAELLEKTFQIAAEAIEAAVRNGSSSERNRGFHKVMAAAAYHLGHYSARSYCLLGTNLEALNLNRAEMIVALLMRRGLKQLEEESWPTLTDGDRSDSGLFRSLEQQSIDGDDALQVILNDSIVRSINIFLYALETGLAAATARAIELLEQVIAISFEFGIVTLWWLSYVTRHLIDDLWNHSLHVRIPPTIAGNGSWASLREHFIDVLWSRDIAEIELWPSQLEAASRVQNAHDDLVAALPTGSGKTRIAELAILRALADGKRIVYVTPLRALSAQIERHLRRTFQPLKFSVSSLYGAIGSTDLDLDSLKNRHIVVSTPEKLDFALRNDPALIDDVGLIVLDEGHTIGEGEREVRYEVLVQRLLRRSDSGDRRLVCLSAIFPEGDLLTEFVSWLRSDEPGEPISCQWRPSRRRFGTIVQSGPHARLDLQVETENPFVDFFLTQRYATFPSRRRRPFPSNDAELVLASAWEFAELDQGVLIFCPQRRSVDSLARLALELHRDALLPRLLKTGASIEEATVIGREWLGVDHPVLQCLEMGIAVHHAKLPRQFLQAIEGLLAAKILKVVIASPTLAQGLNLSAATVIMHSIFRNREVIKPEEFANVAGRAGRAFIDIDGQILYPIFEEDKRQYKLDVWNDLLSRSHSRSLISGIYQLVITLLKRLIVRIPTRNAEKVIEYVLNNAVWEGVIDVPSQAEEKDALQKSEEQLRSLDVAILSLIDDLDCPEHFVPLALDEALKGSLWAREVKKQKPDMQRVLSAILESRARHIWQKTTSSQRRGFYYAGIGLRAGLAIDDSLDELLTLIIEGDRALTERDSNLLVTCVQRFAEIVFVIEPFIPASLPTNWKKTIEGWLTGLAVADLQVEGDTDVNDFIQDGIGYRLTWALEAVRARSSAESSSLKVGGMVAAALEVGAMTPQEILLLRSGLRSRSAAHLIVKGLKPEFATFAKMRRWLLSPEIQGTLEEEDFPSSETRTEWRRFLCSNSDFEQLKWSEKTKAYSATWEEQFKPRERQAVRLYTGPNGQTTIFNMELVPIGELQSKTYARSQGPQACVVGADLASVVVTGFGPGNDRSARK